MIIDRRVIQATIGDNPEVIRECVVEFILTVRAEIKAIVDAVDAENAGAVRSKCHSLKGSVALFGATDLKQACAELETSATEPDWDLIRQFAPRLSALMDEVEFALDNLIAQLLAK